MPEVTVAIPSHDRPLRLRWLLNALEEQTLAPSRFEVLVANDAPGSEIERVIGGHALCAAGVLREIRLPAAAAASFGARHNAAWRAARSPLVAFTHDDCRPDPNWLAQLLIAARAHPGAVIQGRTQPDPEETAVLVAAPWAHSARVDPPTAWGETCNIAYPAKLLDALGGLDEDAHSAAGVAADLAARARARGALLVSAPDAIVNHAVHAPWLPARLQTAWRCGDFVRVVKQHPALRRELLGGVWLKREHAALAGAATGTALFRRYRVASLLALPWVAMAMGHRTYGPRALARSLSELPGRAAIDGVELLGLVYQSACHRTLVL